MEFEKKLPEHRKNTGNFVLNSKVLNSLILKIKDISDSFFFFFLLRTESLPSQFCI